MICPVCSQVAVPNGAGEPICIGDTYTHVNKVGTYISESEKFFAHLNNGEVVIAPEIVAHKSGRGGTEVFRILILPISPKAGE